MDEREQGRILRRRLSRIGWSVFLYLAVGQLGAGVLILLLPKNWSVLGQLGVSYAWLYLAAPLLLWLVIRTLPRGQAPGLSMSPLALARTAVCSVGVLFLFNMLTSLVILLVEALTGVETSNLLETAAENMTGGGFVLLAGIAAPIFEELIFRKLLLDRLRPFGDRAAILISAVAFGLFHMNLYQFFYAVALGLLFAGVVLKTGKIWHTILLHAVVNLSSVGLSALSTLGDAAMVAVSCVMLALAGAAVAILVRYARTYRFGPPSYPVSQRQVAAAALKAPGLWVCGVVCMAISIAVIFLQ